MELLLQITALCLTGCVLSLLLKKEVPALQLLLVVGIAVVLLLSMAQTAGDMQELLVTFSEECGIASDYLLLILKCMAVATVVRIGGDLCRDAGQSALASLIEITGTLSAALLAVPLIKVLIKTVMNHL